ncbi:recombinase family protein [Streptacidiphilus sp. EB103A]|uniref:recombinase family protein n=1 Tax=Streptacidiphilus sp. EB103A TaxID=3156275 RepID=UPI003516C4D1
MTLRVLPCKRISRDTEDSSALERQGVELSEAIHSGDHELVAWVEDATVSGSVNLDQRPSLGKWLTEPLLHQWDALMVTTQDRISRDDLHWWAFVAWVLEHRKTVLVLDDPSLDLTTEDGRMIAGIKATQAAKYRKTVQEKKRNQYYRDEDLWPGGVWPYGYRAERVQHKDAKRWKLVIDPYSAGMVREAYDRIANHSDSLSEVARDWNKRAILCPIDYQRHCNALAGRPGRAAL